MKVAIIVAAGSGKRFGAEMPKQFLILKNKPVLAHSVEVFCASGAMVMVVISAEMEQFWRDQSAQFQVPAHQVICGGAERYHSVKNAIEALPPETRWVAIHDAARPGINLDFVNRMWNAVEEHGSSIPYWPIADSLRLEEQGRWKILDRNRVRSIQTPQCFDVHLLSKAYAQEYQSFFTDDASVVEQQQALDLHYELGLPSNFKITQSQDLQAMESILNTEK
ncbi:MAG: 2-C-methyl-D-erythritol 4-phosphate cytidylyltransferase [Bacteroidetes bacterium]|nr:2-C-methyl-D-erythritol 4-phosphate cytidylyltransferase [Bacteroidota bacterium]